MKRRSTPGGSTEQHRPHTVHRYRRTQQRTRRAQPCPSAGGSATSRSRGPWPCTKILPEPQLRCPQKGHARGRTRSTSGSTPSGSMSGWSWSSIDGPRLSRQEAWVVGRQTVHLRRSLRSPSRLSRRGRLVSGGHSATGHPESITATCMRGEWGFRQVEQARLHPAAYAASAWSPPTATRNGRCDFSQRYHLRPPREAAPS